MNPASKPMAGFWIAVALAVLLAAYLGSFGPVIAYENTGNCSRLAWSSKIYWPLGWLSVNGPPIVRVPVA
jgi:hypothetical protein